MAFYFGNSRKMKELECEIGFIAKSGEPVLLEGESGCGKEALAQTMHAAGGQDGEFVRLLCIRQTAESGLDRFPRGRENTLFLKNVHLLASRQQEMLLLGLERANGTAPRLVSSTSDSLEPLATRGGFLPKLFDRISAHRISVPPLRERAEDIPELFTLMLARMNAELGTEVPPPRAGMNVLAGLAWPGNFRELKNAVRSYVLAPDAEKWLTEFGTKSNPGGAASKLSDHPMALKDQVRRVSQKLESEIILRTLERHRWNRRRTAESLKISYRALLYKMKNGNIGGDGQVPPKERETT